MIPRNILIIFPCIYLFSFIRCDEKCPKVCSICFNDHLSCTNGGLQSIPTNIRESTTKITLIGHTFHSFSLSGSNFSSFSKPKYSIEQLSIRQSNIDTIQRDTFYDLLGLDNLDLSDNRRMKIHYMAFNNLKLKHLKLDNIHFLELEKGAFEGLAVTSLSMKNSHLKTLSFDLLQPISSNLRSLFLSNNKISFLEQRFQKLVLKLSHLDLMGNQFQCTCKLAWLGRVLQDRIKSREALDSTFTYNTLYSNYPTCAGPVHVKDKYIHNISEAEFSCEPPLLEVIDIRFEKVNIVKLRCSAKMTFKKAPIQVFWQEISRANQAVVTYLPLQSGPGEDANQAVTVVRKSADVSLYQCLARSNSGNATIKITINWPPMLNASRGPPEKSLANSNWFEQQNKMSEKNFFFREQFTLLEMLGAVMGTFTVTLTIFLLLYKFCVKATGKVKKANSIKKSGYSIYEAAIYSDSQTYDVPQNNYPIPPPPPPSQGPQAQAQAAMITNNLSSNTPSHYLDYRTQQRISHH